MVKAPSAGSREARRKRWACPMCGRPAVKEYRPFCSARCADLDLAKWLDGRYRIETEQGPDDEPENGDGG